jgi:hypothetical protein
VLGQRIPLGWLLMQAGLLCRSFFPSPLLSSTVSTTCIEVWGSSRELPLGVSCSRFLDGRCWHGPSLRGAAGRHQRPRPWSSWSRHIKASVPVRGCALVMVATAHHLVLCCYFGRNATPLSWVPNLEVALCFYSSSPMAAQQLPPPHTHTHTTTTTTSMTNPAFSVAGRASGYGLLTPVVVQ